MMRLVYSVENVSPMLEFYSPPEGMLDLSLSFETVGEGLSGFLEWTATSQEEWAGKRWLERFLEVLGMMSYPAASRL